MATQAIPKMPAGSMLVLRTSSWRIETPEARTSPLSTSSSPTPLNTNWLADTGATSHMIPHRHWVRNYSSLRMPIRLADNCIIYSSGVGTVVFNPVIGGKAFQPVEFTRVLHVPSLQNNLLSCLYLTKHKGFKIHIDSHWMPSELANWVSTLPLTLSLWHRRCCHHNHAHITKMHKEGLVTGMTSTKPDIVCEPVLLGKCTPIPFHLLPHMQLNHLSWFTLICMALSQLLQRKVTAIGWPSLMMQPPTMLRCNLNRKAMHLMPSKPTRHLQRTEYMSKAFIVKVAFTGNHAHWP